MRFEFYVSLLCTTLSEYPELVILYLVKDPLGIYCKEGVLSVVFYTNCMGKLKDWN